MSRRKIVKIDQEKCDGCGQCVTPCAEGAIAIVDGKARVLRDELCDGAGFCLGVCPNGALTLEDREAQPFDEARAKIEQAKRGRDYESQRCFRCGRDEDSVTVFPCRTGGRSVWVCARCLPGLIHG